MKKWLVGLTLFAMIIVIIIGNPHLLHREDSNNSDTHNEEKGKSKIVVGNREYDIEYEWLVPPSYKIEGNTTYRGRVGNWVKVGNASYIFDLKQGIDAVMIHGGWNNKSVFDIVNRELVLQLVVEVTSGDGVPSWYDSLLGGSCIHTGDEITIRGYNQHVDQLRVRYDFCSYQDKWEDRDRGNSIGTIIGTGEFALKWKVPKNGKYLIYFDTKDVYLVQEGEIEKPNSWFELTVNFNAGDTRSYTSLDIEIDPSTATWKPGYLYAKKEQLTITCSVLQYLQSKYRSGEFSIYFKYNDGEWEKLHSGSVENGWFSISWKPPKVGLYEICVIFDSDWQEITTSYKTINLLVED